MEKGFELKDNYSNNLLVEIIKLYIYIYIYIYKTCRIDKFKCR